MTNVMDPCGDLRWLFNDVEGELGKTSSYEALIAIAQGAAGNKSEAHGPQESERCMRAARRERPMREALAYLTPGEVATLRAFYTLPRAQGYGVHDLHYPEGMAGVVLYMRRGWPKADARAQALIEAREALQRAQRAYRASWAGVASRIDAERRAVMNRYLKAMGDKA